MDWRALLHNRWALAGVGAAGLLGGVVWWRRHKGAAASSSTGMGMAAPAPGYAGGPGSFDSTGTDVAAWLGQQSGMLETQLNEYRADLTDALAALGKVPTAPTGTGTPGPSTLPTGSAPRYVTVTAWTASNTAWSSTLSGIASHEKTTVSRLLQLNPTIKDPNVIRTGSIVRVA